MTKRLRSCGAISSKRASWAARGVIVDAGPLLERSHAAEAGLGFESKAANLLHRDLGPWFFLGELLLEVELEPARAPAVGSCGTCTACIDACPTAAIVAPGQVDSRACISYQTIENRDTIPHELRADLGPWAFGCDVCSEVCPWGRGAPESQTFGDHAAVEGARLTDWLQIPDEAFASRFEGSPLRRPGRDGLARNAALALAAAPSAEGREALDAALSDPSPLVRAAAAWSLLAAHGADRGVRGSVERALAREPDAGAKADIARTLKEVPGPS